MRWKFAVARWVSWLSNQLPVTSDQEIVQNPKSLQRIFWLRKRTKKKPMEPEAISLSLKHGVVSVYCLLFVVFSSKIATSSIWELCFTLLFLQCIKGNPKRVCFWCSSQFWGTTVYWLDTWPEWSKKFCSFFREKTGTVTGMLQRDIPNSDVKKCKKNSFLWCVEILISWPI